MEARSASGRKACVRREVRFGAMSSARKRRRCQDSWRQERDVKATVSRVRSSLWARRDQVVMAWERIWRVEAVMVERRASRMAREEEVEIEAVVELRRAWMRCIREGLRLVEDVVFCVIHVEIVGRLLDVQEEE